MFRINPAYRPRGDQPGVIESVSKGLAKGEKFQTILGATGTGKTYVMAKLIEASQRPALIVSHNKTLAAQLYRELQHFFPDNAVEYFVSYYDYYQPEAYVAARDLYIEKDSSINEDIDRLRLRATTALMERDDVVIVSSVSCIYGLGSPEDYRRMHLALEKGAKIGRNELIRGLVDIQYARNDEAPGRGQFRVRGDVIDVQPAYLDYAIRIELFGDEIEALGELDLLNNRVTKKRDKFFLYPAKHFVMGVDRVQKAVDAIYRELDERADAYQAAGKLLEKERIVSRTRYDMEMLQALGYCNGIENYSRHLAGREPGSPPDTLLQYFPKNFVTFIDESHISVSQIQGMFNGDRARKQSLVDHGFRLPSALDNRPLFLEEFIDRTGPVVFVSATPAEFELERSTHVAELINRPTGLIDPPIEVRKTEGQIDDLLAEVKGMIERGFRTLITTLTKKMSEDLTDYLRERKIKAEYLHSDIETIERVEILKKLRQGEIDVLVGINLLREGLDLPEVALVAILDADKIGFLRSKRSLLQTVGRAARNQQGKVIMYADRMSDAMKDCIDETERRRVIQRAYNEANGITPTTIVKPIEDILVRDLASKKDGVPDVPIAVPKKKSEAQDLVKRLDLEMRMAADQLDFEKAIALREKIAQIKGSLKL